MDSTCLTLSEIGGKITALLQAIIYFRRKDIELRIKMIDMSDLSRPPLLWLLGADLYLSGTHFFPSILEELEPLC